MPFGLFYCCLFPAVYWFEIELVNTWVTSVEIYKLFRACECPFGVDEIFHGLILNMLLICQVFFFNVEEIQINVVFVFNDVKLS
jgi:hypothetical protein